MTSCQVDHHEPVIKTPSILLRGLAATMLRTTSLLAVELPPELPLWESESPEGLIRREVEEQVR